MTLYGTSRAPLGGMRHSERAYECFGERKIDDAVRFFRLASECGEDPECAALERWLTMMTAGHFEEAWRESDRVLARRKESGESSGHFPRHMQWVWDGSPLAGRDVLVRCYHGLGDVIQFVRYVPRLEQICRRVSVQVQPELMELLGSMEGIDELRSLEDSDPAFEVQIELMEVPHALRAALATVPDQVPYLSVNGMRVRAQCVALREERRLRIGLAWASGVWKPERSVPVSLFRFLREMPDEIAVVGLQRGPATCHLPADAPQFVHTDWENNSIADTAATIQNLDLVISTDTMVAHLAGALGVPVWTLLHFHADWRWLADRDDSPWYPTMRLFRQPSAGDWNTVVELVKGELEKRTYYQREGLRP